MEMKSATSAVPKSGCFITRATGNSTIAKGQIRSVESILTLAGAGSSRENQRANTTISASLRNSLGCSWKRPSCSQRRAPNTFFPKATTASSSPIIPM